MLQRKEMDRVCGMWIEKSTAPFTSQYHGESYYFCAKECKEQFDQNPKFYMKDLKAANREAVGSRKADQNLFLLPRDAGADFWLSVNGRDDKSKVAMPPQWSEDLKQRIAGCPGADRRGPGGSRCSGMVMRGLVRDRRRSGSC